MRTDWPSNSSTLPQRSCLGNKTEAFTTVMIDCSAPCLNEVASVTRPRRCGVVPPKMPERILPQRSCLGNKTEAAWNSRSFRCPQGCLNEVASVTRPRLPPEVAASRGLSLPPQRSCLGNKTEATLPLWETCASFGPQRSCLGNKTEAAGRIKGSSQGMILTRHETLSAAGRTFCLLNQGFYHQTLVTSRDSLARDQPVSKVLRPLASHDDGGIVLNHPTLADPRHWKARGALVAKCGHED